VRITNIKRFAVHDGSGIRTTVFFKGCPLKCIWCHNPETISPRPEMGYYQHKCVSCGRCALKCASGVQVFENGVHSFKRELCVSCGVCAKVCPVQAMELYGTEYTVEEITPLLLEDEAFYRTSNGGITLSGGECLLQDGECAALLAEMKKHNIHTAVDTCGNVSRSAIDTVLPLTDIFLYDIKAVDEDMHIKYTGKSNKLIINNLMYLDNLGAPLEIRIPLVPGCNDSEIEAIRELLSSLRHPVKARIIPYHDFARTKYKALLMDDTMPEVIPDIIENKEIKLCHNRRVS